MKRQFSGGPPLQGINYLSQLNINPQNQQYIEYNTNSNAKQIQNLYNTNYNITVPNIHNNEYIYQSNKNNNQKNSYIVMGNQIIDNNNEGFNLINDRGYYS